MAANISAGKHLTDIVRQMLLILLISAALGAAVNLVRPEGIPFVATWSMAETTGADSGDNLAISLEDAAALFADDAAVFLDARPRKAYDQGHIKNAVSLPWQKVDNHFETVIVTLDPEAMIITYCDGESCDLSHELALFLKEMGFENVRVLVNGWTVWQQAGLPTGRKG